MAMSLLILAVSFMTANGGRTIFGPMLGVDYVGFYVAGAILNREPADGRSLYDYELQDRLYHEILPGAEKQERLPYIHPPFVAFALRPLARLPYSWSFGAWLLISALLYVAGLALTMQSVGSLARGDRVVAFLLALSFEPFILECWLGGQLSAIGFFCLALAFSCWQARRPFVSGLALGLCLYKPTLLVLMLPLLVFARHWRMLAGFLVTSLGLAGVSLLAVGWQGSLDFLEILTRFAQVTTENGTPVLRLFKYVDLNSFCRLLFGAQPFLNALILLAVAAPAIGLLALAWWRIGGGTQQDGYRQLVWASTLIWTLVINLYVGVYDAILAVAAALLAAAVISSRDKEGRLALTGGFQALLALLYIVPWGSQHLARWLGFQPYTLVLLAFGIYLLVWVRASEPEA